MGDGTCGVFGGDKSYKCCRPTCQHDRTKCRDAFNDCCGEFGNIGTCADGFTAYPVGTCGLLGWDQQYECKFGCHTKPPPKPSRVGREGCEFKCYDRHDKLKKDMCYKAKCAGCSGCASLLQASIKNNEGDSETIGANMSEADCVHDKHKCRDAFNDCCGEFGNLGSCADGYKVQEDGTCGVFGGDKSYKCCRPTCQHDRTKCRDAFNDCCGEFGNIGTCADGFTAYPVGTCGLLGWQQQYECKFGCHTKPPPKPSRVGREGCEFKCYDRHD